MLQRITDLWPGLLRRVGGNGEDEVNDGRPPEFDLDVLRAEAEESYSNLRWTRVASLQQLDDQ